jgi:hypothetical protein
MPNRPLTDAIDALTAYANSVTGESDTNLPDAVRTLADGYGQGGGDSIWNTIVDRTVTEIDDTDGLCKTVGAYAFYYCTSLTSVIFPSVKSIETSAFQGCTRLSSVYLPLARSVENSGFSRCTKLSSTYLPSATSIANSAFYNCSALKVVDLPNAASIGAHVFNGCLALKTLILRKSDSICTLSNSNALSNTPINSGTGYIYVPSALIETYKTASNWTSYAAKFRALEDYTVDGTITGDLDPTKI